MSLKGNALAFVLGISIISAGYAVYKHGPLIAFVIDQQIAKMQPKPEPITEEQLPETPKQDVVVETPNPEMPSNKDKQWVGGYWIEWRIPEDVRKIRLRYKEANGRVKMEYDFEVSGNERVEIKVLND